MKEFADLFLALDQTNKTNRKVELLADYFKEASDSDKLWVLALFTHKRPKRQINTTLLKTWASELANIPDWLFKESYGIVGDLAETISLTLPPPTQSNQETLTEWMNFIQTFGQYEEDEKKQLILESWDKLTQSERFIFLKLMTGSFRVGVSQKLIVKGLAKGFDKDANSLAHRLMGNWTPDNTTFEELILDENASDDISRPYPFCLAYALDDVDKDLGNPQDWLAEWKWDGIRGQLIVRGGEIFVWSRGEELVTDKYPELDSFRNLPDGIVLDGEILGFRDGKPLSFNHLQTRIGRKTVSKKTLKDAPVAFVVYDLLEFEGEDMRQVPFAKRRAILEKIYGEFGKEIPSFEISQMVDFENFEDLASHRDNSREMISEGLMIKKKDSVYHTGRKRGDWWKWKVDPFTIDAVMVYAQKGSGRRAGLFSDYTFAVWDNDKLVTFAKAYSGLTDAEIRKVDAFVKRNTLERFGPVRTVKPEQVFELAFEGIQESKRHKSGVALRFPRIFRWRTDKKPEEADTLETLKKFLEI